MNTLSELDRAILLMTTLEGMHHRAIGEAVGLSEASVKLRIYRARVHLNATRRNREHPS